MEPGREGGTWLGISKTGKIGSLLNIFHGTKLSNVGKKGRGLLVNNYLLSKKDGEEYLREIQKDKGSYMPFCLVTVDIL
jgi:uncharacterized protein with NRDE domain